MVWWAVASLATSVYSGSKQKDAAKAQAGMAEDDARLLKWEAEREAAITRDEGIRYAKEQAMAYMSSGVQLEGSALLTVAETIKLSETEAKAIEYRGGRMADMKNREASIYRKQGRASFISSIFSGASNAASIYSARG